MLPELRLGGCPYRPDMMAPAMLTGARTELGSLLAARAGARTRRVHFNLAGQQANTLLHDGHAWEGFHALAPAGARRAVRAAAAGGATLLVHAGFAMVRAQPPRDPLRSLALAALECEAIVLSGPVPACVVRLGYLYGPASRDLRAYRDAFRLGRPYWSGPRDSRQDHLHQQDAVAALLAAAKPRNARRILYATDGHPLAYLQFMDHFARLCGRRHPLHAPLLARPLMKLIVREEHMQQVELAVPGRAPGPRVPGWRPAFADYRRGLADALAAWPPE